MPFGAHGVTYVPTTGYSWRAVWHNTHGKQNHEQQQSMQQSLGIASRAAIFCLSWSKRTSIMICSPNVMGWTRKNKPIMIMIGFSTSTKMTQPTSFMKHPGMPFFSRS